MIYNNLLNKTVSKLTTRGALQYVHQDPNGGEFVASDGTVMLIENTGTPFLAEFWDADTQTPVDCADEYPDWRGVLSDGAKNAKKSYNTSKIVIKDGYAIFDKLHTSAKTYQLVRDFIGADIAIYIPNNIGQPIYFRNADKSRQALIMPYNIYAGATFKVLNATGEIVYTTTNLQEAEMFDLTVRIP